MRKVEVVINDGGRAKGYIKDLDNPTYLAFYKNEDDKTVSRFINHNIITVINVL